MSVSTKVSGSGALGVSIRTQLLHSAFSSAFLNCCILTSNLQLLSEPYLLTEHFGHVVLVRISRQTWNSLRTSWSVMRPVRNFDW